MSGIAYETNEINSYELVLITYIDIYCLHFDTSFIPAAFCLHLKSSEAPGHQRACTRHQSNIYELKTILIALQT